MLCAIGFSNLLFLVQTDIEDSNAQIRAAFEDNEYVTQIAEADGILQEELGVSLIDMLIHPEDSVDNADKAVTSVSEQLQQEFDKMDIRWK